MITLQDQRVAVQGGRTGGAPLQIEGRVLLAQVPLPQRLALHVEGDDLPGAEPGINPLAIAHRAGAGEVVLVVHRVLRILGRELVLPKQAAGGAIERRHGEHHDRIGGGARAAERLLDSLIGSGTARQRRVHAALPHAPADLVRHEDAIANHDRRRHAQAPQLRLPGDVVGVGPGSRQRPAPGYPGAVGPAPVRPVAGFAGVDGIGNTLLHRIGDTPRHRTDRNGPAHQEQHDQTNDGSLLHHEISGISLSAGLRRRDHRASARSPRCESDTAGSARRQPSQNRAVRSIGCSGHRRDIYRQVSAPTDRRAYRPRSRRRSPFPPRRCYRAAGSGPFVVPSQETRQSVPAYRRATGRSAALRVSARVSRSKGLRPPSIS